jgi:hypothetical protein
MGKKGITLETNERIEETLEADGGARPAAHALAARTFEMPWENGHPIRQAQQPADTLVLRRGVTTAKVRTPNISNEQRITRENHRRLRASFRIDYQDRDQLGAVARCMQDSETELAERKLLVVLQRSKRVGYAGCLMETQLSRVLGSQFPGSGNVIGVDVRINDIAQNELPLV